LRAASALNDQRANAQRELAQAWHMRAERLGLPLDATLEQVQASERAAPQRLAQQQALALQQSHAIEAQQRAAADESQSQHDERAAIARETAAAAQQQLATAALAQAADWHARWPAAARWASQAVAFRALGERLARSESEIAAATVAVSDLSTERLALAVERERVTVDATRTDAARASAALAAATANAALAQAVCAHGDGAQLDEQIAALNAQAAQLGADLSAWTRIKAQRTVLAERRAHHAALAETQARALSALTPRRDSLALAQVALDDADQALIAAQRSVELAARRPELLQPDAPCPLCGSRSHPHAHEPGPGQAWLIELSDAQAVARAWRTETQQRLDASLAVYAEAERAASIALGAADEAERESAQAERDAPTNSAEDLELAQDNLRTLLEQAQVKRAQWRSLAQQADAGAKTLQRAIDAAAAAISERTRIEHTLSQREHAHAHAEQRRASAQREHSAQLDALKLWLGDDAELLAKLLNDPDGALTQIAQVIADAPGKIDALAAAQRALEHHRDVLRTAVAERERAAHAAQTAMATHRERLSTRAELNAQWRALSGGLSLHEHEQRYAAQQRAHGRWQQAHDRLATLDAQPIDAAALTDAKAIDALNASIADALQTQGAIEERLSAAARAQQRADELTVERDVAAAELALWDPLDRLIGSADGAKFRAIAQSHSLDLLIILANAHLKLLRPRYRLIRPEASELGLAVIDQDLDDDLRSVESLSGGESFLVALALALGLADLSASERAIESLFIDEGFGALDASTLDETLAVLDLLHAQGRQITLISHLPEVAERVGDRIDVRPTASGLSAVAVGL
jgi:DNA repair protein SbcC/Rad50